MLSASISASTDNRPTADTCARSDITKSGTSKPLSTGPSRGRRNWKNKFDEQQAVYANRRRCRGRRGRRLMRSRGELIERSFAHDYETGAMRRTHLKKHNNILKRLLIHTAGFNLALTMRTLYGVGKPRRLQGLFFLIWAGVAALLASLPRLWRQRRDAGASESTFVPCGALALAA